MNFSEKLEDAEETKLESIPGRASKGGQEVFQPGYDELFLDEPGATRYHYNRQEQRFERYLYDLHEWARVGYERLLSVYEGVTL